MLVLAAVCACERSDRSAAPPAPESPSAVSAGDPPVALETGAVAALPSVDLPSLRFDGPDRSVLVRERAKSYVTAGEYNAWLGTYPLNIRSPEPGAARREALDQMVFWKLVVERARLAGYEAKLAPSGEAISPNSLALTYMRDQLTQIGAISDEQAVKFAAEHRELAPILDDPNLPRVVWMLAVKGAIRGDQMRADIDAWRLKRGIAVDESVLASN